MKKRSLFSRLGTMALAGVMAFGSLGVMGTPMTVHAAPQPYKSAPTSPVASGTVAGASNGDLVIGAVDSDVYGTDSNTAGEGYNIIGPAGCWEGSDLTPWHFAHTPQGKSTFEGSKLYLYERNPDPKEKQNVIGDCLATAEYKNGYFVFKENILDTELVNGGKYIVVQGNSAALPAIAGNSLTNFNNASDAKENGEYVGWYFMFNKVSDDVYEIPNPNTGELTISTGFGFVVDYHQQGNNMVPNYNRLSRPLQTHPYYAGFSIDLMDKDFVEKSANYFKSQGDANLTDGAKFAVFNISAQSAYGYAGKTNVSTRGYVVADRDNNGKLSPAEQKVFIPAYDLNVIKAAYSEYLSAIKNYNGPSVDNESLAVYESYKDTEYDGTFTLSGKSGKDAIVPVMILEPDENNVLATSGRALPVGDYLILQVSAGKGYYIDENFNTIVSIGHYTNGDMTSAFTPEALKSAVDHADYYGNLDKYGPYDLYNASKFMSVGTGAGTYQSKADILGGLWAGYNIAYINADADDGSQIYGNSKVHNLSDINKGELKIVTNNGRDTIPHTKATGVTFTDTDANRTNYVLSDGVSNGKTRLAPVAGHNKFIAHDTIIRGGDTFYLADDDDYRHINKPLNVREDDIYLQISQGNGDLANTNGTPNAVASFTITNNSKGPVVVNGSVCEHGDPITKVYEVSQTDDEDKFPILDVAIDNLPYGKYTIEQTVFGEGYKQSANNDNGGTLSSFTVTKEDSINASNPYPSNAANGRKYFTNQLVDGGEVYKVTTNEGDPEVTVDLKVYNISDHYVYVDGKDGKDSKRFETSKELYELNIKDQDLTMDEVAGILEDVEPCKVVSGLKPSEVDGYTFDNTLHYGSYLIVVSGIPDKYKLITPAYGVDEIEKEDGDIKFEVHIEPESVIPEVSTVLVEASNKIDSVKVDKEVALYDTVTVKSILPSAQFTDLREFRLYGVIVDQETGELVPGQIATTTAKPERAKEGALEATATVEMYFPTMNTWDYEGRTFVAYQFVCPYTPQPIANYTTPTTLEEFRLLIKDIYLTEHSSIVDEEQTVYVPSMTITAEASLTHGKVIDPTETVIGTTTVGNLEPGNTYKLVSYLYDEAGEKVTNGDGEDAPALEVVETFTAVSDTKTCTEKFEDLDASKYNNQRLTVYSTLYRVIDKNEYELITKGDADSIGYDPSDETPGDNQVDVKCPTVKTVFTGKNGAKTVDFSDPEATVTVTDTVTYTNLIVGGKYRSVLTLVDSTGMGLLDDDGKALTVTKEFEAISETQVVKLNLEFIATEAAGQDVIAYNDLYRVNSSVIKKVAEEHDLTSELQTIKARVTVNKPTLVTVAKDSNTKSHTLSLDSSIIDTVNGMYLDPNTDYVLVTELAVNGAVFDRIEPIRTAVQTDEEGRFVAKVTIGGYNAEALKGKKLTVFETLYNKVETKIICEHKDAEDENQTVSFGEMTTVAVGKDGKKEIARGEKVEIIDNIHYEGLTPGFTYTITSTAMLSSGGGGTPIGTPVNTKFTPDAAKGDVSIKIILDTTAYGDMDIVMFESITEDYSDSVVIEHKDISDASQTVHVAPGPDDPNDPDDPNNPDDPDNPDGGDGGSDPDKPQTGVMQNFFLYFALAIVTFVSGIIAFIVNKRKKVAVDK